MEEEKIKVSLYLTRKNKELLDNIAFLKKVSKVSLINKAVESYLITISNEDKELEERLKKLK
jgi:hypothetical protein